VVNWFNPTKTLAQKAEEAGFRNKPKTQRTTKFWFFELNISDFGFRVRINQLFWFFEINSKLISRKANKSFPRFLNLLLLGSG
jgi:hypothetical protein